MNSINRLIDKYNARSIEDDGAYNSAEMKCFFKDFKKALKDMDGLKIEKVSLGHYGISGFVSANGNTAYFDISVPRGGLPMDMYEPHVMKGIMYRQARDTKDFRGGPNHFTSYVNFEKDVKALLARGGEL